MSIASQLSFSTATSLRGGALGSIPYQSATSSTVFVPIGAAGTLLTSNGTTATWALASSTTVGTGTQVQTVLRTTNASHFLTFVDSNNASATAESVYTTSSFTINPQSGNVGFGTSSPTKRLQFGGQTGPVNTPLALQFADDYSSGSTATGAKIFLYNTGGTEVYGFGIGPISDIQYHAGGASNTAGKHIWYTANNEKMRITFNGALAFNGASNFGSSGQILQSNGDAAPTWVAVSGLTAGTATTATQVQTILRTTNASHFLTFVDSNNASATGEIVYTTSTVVVNPQSSNVGIGTSSPSTRLTIEGTAAAAATVTVLTLRNSSDGGVGMSFTNSVSVPLASISALVTSTGAGTDDGILSFSTAVNGVITERFRADASGSLILNGTVGGTGNAIVLRGGTAASSEGPQIIMGYGNNTSSAITGQANSTWNIDVAAGLANNNFRIFRQNSAGATVVGAEFTEASGGVQLISVGVGTTSSGVTGEIRATNEITAYFSSDIRLKENIRLIADPITIVNQIRGVYYDWTDEHIKARGGEDGYFVRKHDIGVIAQEVEAVLPEIVATRDDGTKVVKYEKLVALLIEVVKDQQRQINQISQALEKLAIK